MQKTMKRIGALALSLMMLVTFMPVLGLSESVHADGEEESEGITVYMTISNKGVIAEANDASAMAWKEVNVKDLDADGKYTFDEALKAAHEAYNSADGYATSGDTVKKLWGSETTNTLFFINGEGLSTGVTVDEISADDYLIASVNADENYYADWISSFDSKQITVGKGEPIELSLKGRLGMAWTDEAKQYKPLNGIQIGCWEDGSFNDIEDAVTDENGTTSLTFDEPGTYIVTAKGTTPTTATDWNLWDISGADAKIFGYMDEDTYETFVAYTDDNYGDGPYPADEINYIAYMELDDDDEWVYPYKEKNYCKSNTILTDAPIIAPCCIVNVVENAEVSLTVSNQGMLAADKDNEAMADKCFTAYDDDNDGKVSVNEALLYAHKQYYKDGESGYAIGDSYWGGKMITRFWGIDTSNIMTYLNGEGINDMMTDTVEDYDKLYVAIMKDEVNWSDIKLSFEESSMSQLRGRNVGVYVYGSSTMGIDVAEGGLAGLKIGLWKDGQFEPIEGAVTDEDGYASFKIAEEGNYVITAQGTVKGMLPKYDDTWTEIIGYEEADCPIMAPYCLLEIYKNEDEEAAYSFADALYELPAADELKLSDKAAVEKVRAMYDALSEKAKEYVWSEDLNVLKLAEATVGKLDAEDKLSTAEKAAAEKQKEVEKLEGELKTANDNLKAAQDAAAKSDAAAKAAQDDLKAAQEAQAKAEAALKTAQDELAKAQGSASGAAAQVEALNNEIKNLEETVKVQKKQVKKVKAKGQKKKAKVTWKSLGSGYKYQVYKSTKLNGKFKKAATAKKAKAVVKKLKKGKTYYIKVRGFKKVNGKTVYTQFSETVKVKAK